MTILEEKNDIIKSNQSNYPVKIIKLANDLGISVYSTSFKNDISGAILKKDNKYVIYFNNKDNKNRQRFTIAHEIAHFLLHKDKIGDNLTDIPSGVMYRSRLSNIYEKQANRLASEILIPLKLLRNLLLENITDISKLADLFQVSEEGIRIRLKEGENIFLPEDL